MLSFPNNKKKPNYLRNALWNKLKKKEFMPSWGNDYQNIFFLNCPSETNLELNVLYFDKKNKIWREQVALLYNKSPYF